jgi:5-methylcytosine-specific restriction enzyme A
MVDPDQPWAPQDLEHLYGSARWKRMRRYQLQEHPLCKFCLENGCVTVATICDHIEPHRGDINKFWMGALQSLCHACHVRTKHDIEERGYRRDIGLDGWPLDPKHPCYAFENRNKRGV